MTNTRRTGIVYLCAIGIAAICCLVAATRVYINIDPVRIKVLNSPAVPLDGSVRVPLSDARVSDLPAHIAVIVRIHNGASTKERFAVRLDERSVCDAWVSAAATRRVDCAVADNWQQARSRSRELVVNASSSAWQLDYVEVATQHGSGTNPLRMFVLPAASEAYRGPGPIWIAVAGVLIAALWLLPALPITGALANAQFLHYE